MSIGLTIASIISVGPGNIIILIASLNLIAAAVVLLYKLPGKINNHL